MSKIRTRIENRFHRGAAHAEWMAGNLIPADDADALAQAYTKLCPSTQEISVEGPEVDYVRADVVEARIAEAVAAEREKCALIAEKAFAATWRLSPKEIAAAIRSNNHE